MLATPAAPTLETQRPILSIIHPLNLAGRRVAERVGERRTGELLTPFREPCEIGEMRREDWPERVTG